MTIQLRVYPGISPRGNNDIASHGGWPAGIRPHEMCRKAHAGSDVVGQDACQERAGGVEERAGACQACAGPVKLQTKALLCSDRHSSPGELRMAKGQMSTGKHAGAGSTHFG